MVRPACHRPEAGPALRNGRARDTADPRLRRARPQRRTTNPSTSTSEWSTDPTTTILTVWVAFVFRVFATRSIMRPARHARKIAARGGQGGRRFGRSDLPSSARGGVGRYRAEPGSARAAREYRARHAGRARVGGRPRVGYRLGRARLVEAVGPALGRHRDRRPRDGCGRGSSHPSSANRPPRNGARPVAPDQPVRPAGGVALSGSSKSRRMGRRRFAHESRLPAVLSPSMARASRRSRTSGRAASGLNVPARCAAFAAAFSVRMRCARSR